eukprot:TRINITY_DN25346_c0_g1_i1.p1 TRINITY_DN25346_c0_g1~~TRINITY_DN25346_c0_g1_i1.p1  ORF type:complete len:621 (+),score=179.03 TRINITY_DN25346_c0_g1_i1:98-1960(+)
MVNRVLIGVVAAAAVLGGVVLNALPDGEDVAIAAEIRVLGAATPPPADGDAAATAAPEQEQAPAEAIPDTSLVTSQLHQPDKCDPGLAWVRRPGNHAAALSPLPHGLPHTSPWQGMGSSHYGCVKTTITNLTDGAYLERMHTKVLRRGEPGARCWAITGSGPCQNCCEFGRCLRRATDLKKRKRRVVKGLQRMNAEAGLLAWLNEKGEMKVEDGDAMSIISAWGLVARQLKTPDETPVLNRTIIMLPVKATAIWAFMRNYGHWLSGVFAPVLLAAAGRTGPIMPIVFPSCAHERTRGGKHCRFHDIRAAAQAGLAALEGAAVRVGLPWPADLIRESRASWTVPGYWRLALGCELCPPQMLLFRTMPVLRRWLSLQYEGFSFDRLPLAVGRSRQLLILNRMPHGTRWIANAAQMRSWAAALGWNATLRRVDRPCGYARDIATLMHSADVVVGFNGVDLSIAATLQKPGSVIVEIIDEEYAYIDAWEMFQGMFGSELQVLRLVIPHDTISYPVSGPGARAETNAAVATIKSAATLCMPYLNATPLFQKTGCWRFHASETTVARRDWERLLDKAASMLSERDSTAAPTAHPTAAPNARRAAPLVAALRAAGRKRGTTTTFKRR